MNKDRIKKEAEAFFEWPTKDKSSVSFVSMIIFCNVIAEMAIEEEREACGWKPIETAPRDGTKILAWNDEYGQRETSMGMFGKGSPGFEKWQSGNGPICSGWNWLEPINGWLGTWNPTHWKPLPAAPKDEVSE